VVLIATEEYFKRNRNYFLNLPWDLRFENVIAEQGIPEFKSPFRGWGI
jgi:hypothetical protein